MGKKNLSGTVPELEIAADQASPTFGDFPSRGAPLKLKVA